MPVKKLGLIGFPLSHSLSERYFRNKFTVEKIEAEYSNFEILDIRHIRKIIADNGLSGVNVTIPYKESVLPFLDEIREDARKIGAVNTINVRSDTLTGFNTDYTGFWESFSPLISDSAKNAALVLGSGGGSKAIVYALYRKNIPVTVVSRTGRIAYKDLSREMISAHNIIINTTPLGSFPSIETCPDIPYRYLDSRHLLYDLVYNPGKSVFLQKGENQGCRTKNGLEMLERQADLSWQIWNR